MNTKYTLTLLLSALLSIGSLMAQNQNQNRNERIEALKISFFTNNLSLSANEAKTFWPVFNQFEAAKKELRQQHRNRAGASRQTIDQLTDAEAEALISSELVFQQKILELNKRYIHEFKKILPSTKVAILLTLENKFKRHIIQMTKDRK